MRGAEAYRQVDLTTAPPPRVLDELYGRLLQDMDGATTRIQARDVAGKAALIDHALCIVTELVAALDHDVAPDLCANLEMLYGFVSDKLTEASARLDPKPLAEAQKVVNVLREAFRQAATTSQP